MPKRHRPIKFKHHPDPITEDEINIKISWTADARTTAALERQAQKIGFDTVDEYVLSAVVQYLVMDEEDAVVADDGRILCGWETEGEDGFSKSI